MMDGGGAARALLEAKRDEDPDLRECDEDPDA